MSRANFRPWVMAAALLAGPSTASVAWATATAKSVQPLGTSLTGPARVAYDAGKLAYAAGDMAGALAQFTRAHELSGDPRLLWNMAACEKSVRHYARATTLVSRYLKEGAGILTADAVASAVETQKALRAFYSVLSFRNAPDGARVTVDGEFVGTLPLAQDLAIDIGPHAVRVEKEGFVPFTANVSAPGQTDLTLEVTLRREDNAARLAIQTDAAGAIAGDGVVVGTGRWEGALAAGPHTVRVSATGKKTHEASVDVAAKEARTLQISLEDEAKMPLWPWIVGGAAVVGGAVVGGYFLFKPKEEPGQVPVGKLGTVVLPSGVRF